MLQVKSSLWNDDCFKSFCCWSSRIKDNFPLTSPSRTWKALEGPKKDVYNIGKSSLLQSKKMTFCRSDFNWIPTQTLKEKPASDLASGGGGTEKWLIRYNGKGLKRSFVSFCGWAISQNNQRECWHTKKIKFALCLLIDRWQSTVQVRIDVMWPWHCGLDSTHSTHHAKGKKSLDPDLLPERGWIWQECFPLWAGMIQLNNLGSWKSGA